MTLSTVIATPVVAAVRSAAAVQASEREKSEAARVLGIVAGPELLVLNDRDFVAAMYYKADDLDKQRPLEPEHQKLREAAIAALAADDAACNEFIKTGIYTAHNEDLRIVDERRQRQAEEREAKAKAAAALSIQVDNTILAKPVFDFIVHLELNADNHKDIAVKEAARVALAGSAEAQWTFLTVGIHDEHRKDLDRLIREDKEKTEAEKAAALAREAKANAWYHALGKVADNRVRDLSDQDFVIEVWNGAPRSSEVYGAAEAAVRSRNPVEWKKFIDTGARDARLRDIEIELDRRDKEYIRQITEVRTRAVNSLVYLELVKAADAALAGSPIDREKFLRTGQYEHQTQSFRLQTHQGQEHYIFDSGTWARWNPSNYQRGLWKIEAGLANPACFSFQSVTRPNHYLRVGPRPEAKAQAEVPAQGGPPAESDPAAGEARSEAADDAESEPSVPPKYRVGTKVEPIDGTPEFKAESTWCVKRNGAGISFHPHTDPSSYLHISTALDNERAGQSAVYFVEPPQLLLPIQRRYLADAKLRESLGKPIGDPVIDWPGWYTGYQQYEKGRLFQTYEFHSPYPLWGANVAYNGPVLDKLLELGGPHPLTLGGFLSDQAPTKDGKGQVIRIQKPKAGGDNLYFIWSPDTGARMIYGIVGNTWTATGGETGTYGYPLNDPTSHGDKGIVFQRFVSGSIYHVPNVGNLVVNGDIHKKFAEMGFETGMGAPLDNGFNTLSLFRQKFEKGRIDKNHSGGLTIAYSTVDVAANAVQIKSFESGHCIQAPNVAEDAGLASCQTGPLVRRQTWNLQKLGNNQYKLQNRETGKCLLSRTNMAATPSIRLVTTDCADASAVFEFTTAPDGTVALRDLQGNVAEAQQISVDGPRVVMGVDLVKPNQRWTIVPVS